MAWLAFQKYAWTESHILQIRHLSMVSNRFFYLNGKIELDWFNLAFIDGPRAVI